MNRFKRGSELLMDENTQYEDLFTLKKRAFEALMLCKDEPHFDKFYLELRCNLVLPLFLDACVSRQSLYLGRKLKKYQVISDRFLFENG